MHGFFVKSPQWCSGFCVGSFFAHVQMSSTSFARRAPDYNQHGWFGLQKKLCNTFSTQTSKHSVISHQ